MDIPIKNMHQNNSMIDADNLIYSYDYAGAPSHALDGTCIRVKPGELVAILGHNGCGKSTLAKHLNALLPLQSGTLTVAGMDAADPANQSTLRRKVGMVFQNPDNQFVSTLIEEDVAFGLRNYDVPEEMIEGKVKEALHTVGMDGYEQKAPHSLSGGQRQRIALAGVLAMDPEILVFDEATAMLDPEGRKEVLAMIRKLHRKGKTIVMITHYVEEALDVDRIYLMHDGKMLANGTPREMLTDLELLAQTGLTPPMPVQMYYDLKAQGISLPYCPLTLEELAVELAGEPAEEFAGEPAKEFAGEPAKEFAGEPAEEFAGEPAGELAEELAVELAGELAKELVVELAEELCQL